MPDTLLIAARSQAQAAGYTAGWASGSRAASAKAAAEADRVRAAADRAAAQHAERYRAAVIALDAAAAALERRSVPSVGELEELIVTSALAIAEELVGHSLRNDPNRAVHALTRALALAPVEEHLTVRLCPDDHATLTATGSPVAAAHRQLTLTADPTLQPGDAVVTSGATTVDARIAAGLARVREVLRR